MQLLKYISYGLLLCFTLNASAYYTKNGQIYDNQGNKLIINGVSWSGFQDTNVFQGLQNNPFYSLTTPSYPRSYGMMDLLVHPWDFNDSGVNRSTAVEFKTVRLPIQPDVLYDDFNQVDLNKSLTDKQNPRAGNGIFCKIWQSQGNFCERAVSPKQAFWTVLQEMKRNNIKVMIDMHHRHGYGDGMRDGTVYEMGQYEKDLVFLAQDIKRLGYDNVIGIDIFNEPYKLNWFKNKNNQVPWAKVIATAAKAVFQANPDLLLFVEGPGGGNDDMDNPVICIAKHSFPYQSDGYSHWDNPQICGDNARHVSFKGNWGEDFKPLLDKVLATKGEAKFDINNFEQALYQQVPNLNNSAIDWLLGDDKAGNNGHIVFSPHVYPKEVAGWETEAGAASNLRFDWSWGFLHKAGYPIVLGEASWKSFVGKDFLVQGLMPYLAQSGIGTHNVYFWAIGMLGDTVSAINPYTGELDLDVQKTLKGLWG